MPKFLDAPQRYTSNGTLIDMETPGTVVAGKYFGTNATGTIGYHNNQFVSVNGVVPSGVNIYVPTSKGETDEFLYWNSSGKIDSKAIEITKGTDEFKKFAAVAAHLAS